MKSVAYFMAATDLCITKCVRRHTQAPVLSHCHNALSRILTDASTSLESLAAAQCVERHRMDWRPEVVHTVLLAESHVYTSDSELLPMQGPHSLSHRALNTTFARFVYCLGYGESQFVGPSGPNTAGTPQFWKLFASCVQAPSAKTFAPFLKSGNPEFLSRMRAKVALLERLRAKGIWLVDASAIALYSPGGNRLHHQDYESVLRLCWNTYTGQLVRNAAPHSVIVIGKGVARALERELAGLTAAEIHCVNQPQGCRVKGQIEQVYATLHTVCQHAAHARGAP